MAYQSLYRRYRPQRFGELRGQDHVSVTLRNAVREAKVGHAYLFSGPRGTGKTSTARILAKALNCENPVDGEPCGVCESCRAIVEGRSLDVFELDAASKNGVEAMRDLVDRVALGTPGTWKVYIVDEVHMLSPAASNTLLKTLEEPPAHVIFVLATTEPQKVLPTIRSRTQHFEFRLLPAELLAEYLRWVADDAGLDVAPEAIDLVARRGSGSARDALSVLDQVAAAGHIEPEPPTSDELVEALCERDAGRALAAVAERCAAGHDPRHLTRELVEHLRNVFLATMARSLVALPDDDVARVEGQGRRLGPAATVRAMEVLGEMLVAMRDAPDPRVLLEVALVRLCRPELDDSPAAILQRLERLERGLASGPSPPAPGQPAPPPSEALPPANSGGPPTDAARQALAGSRPPSPPPAAPGAAGAPVGAAAPSPPPPPPPPPRRPPTPPAAAQPPPAPPSNRPVPPPPPSSPDPSAAGGDGPLPSREELTLAWGDHVLAKLSQPARARFRVGRFSEVTDSGAVFTLANTFELDRCKPYLNEVQSALGQHFGQRVPLTLAVGGQASPATTDAVVAPEAMAPPDDEEPVDWDDLQEAPPTAVASPVDHVMQVFEGAQVVEE